MRCPKSFNDDLAGVPNRLERRERVDDHPPARRRDKAGLSGVMLRCYSLLRVIKA